ncbi:glycosyltransferase family 2 protein [Gammaproteobacteria bacterium]|jgi:glycosyltransferase involved in cell wall biosynthesis|nr:glycosyltransferase family 2 protein [Gammaproteobacteria bacterium]
MNLKSISSNQKKHIRQVSVIIPTYNDGNKLKEAIISVSNSSYPLYEIIVVDDGSITLDAKLIVDSLISSINVPLIYKRKDNGGPSSARNLGIHSSHGNWIAFLDSDDTMLPNSIESKFNHLDSCKHNNISGIYGSFIWSTSNLTQSFIKSYKPISRNYIGIMGKVPGGVPSFIFKKNALIDIGGFDESLIFNEDFDLLLRLIKSGHRLIGTNKPGFIRNVQENSLTRLSVLKSLEGGRYFLKKAFQEKLLDYYEIFKRLITNYLITFKQLCVYIIKEFLKKYRR